MKTRSLIGGMCLALAGLPAVAQDAGFYVGGQIGQASARQICANASACDKDEMAFKGIVGYQLNRYVGGELGYQYMGLFGRNGQGVAASAFDAVAVGRYPVVDQLSVYGKLGLYMGTMKSAPLSEDSTGLTYGVGAEYAVTREVSLRGEWQRYNNMGGGSLGFQTDMDVLAGAVIWRPR